MDKVKAAATLLGSLGGSRNTKAQNQARARNGKNGGRPPKNKVKIVVDKPERSDIITP